MNRIEAVSLFDVENVETMPKVRDMIVGPANSKDIREFGRRYHYGREPGSITGACYGLWSGPVLFGVIAFGVLSPAACRAAFTEGTVTRVRHMSRLMLADNAPHNSESRLIGGALHRLGREHPQIWAVITYADIGQGHIGTVYQATNALYTGTGGTTLYYVDGDGNRRGSRTTRGGGGSLTRRDAARLGLHPHLGSVKHRYVYILGSKTQRRQRRKLLRYDVLPYPKAGAA